MKDNILKLALYIVFIFFTCMYLYGAIQLLSNKNYSGLQTAIGIIFAPYTIFVGIDELTASKQQKEIEVKKSKEVLEIDNYIKHKFND